jgi:hypothetical protein
MVAIAEVKMALAAVLETVPGIQKVKYRVPRAIAAGDMPLGLVMTGPATYSAVGAATDVDLPTRTYLVRLYVAHISAGVSGEIEALVEPFLESVPAALAANPRLNRTVLRARVVRDSGVRTLPFQREEYLGTEFSVEVET